MITSAHGKEMLANCPRYYEASRVFQSHIEAKGIELDDLDSILSDIEAQFSASTATWGLRYWEEICDLIGNERDSIEMRRARVLAKLRSFPSARRIDLERVIASFVTGYFDLLVYPSFYTFYVRTAWDKVIDLNGLMKALEEARPAHIHFGILGIPDRMLLFNQAGALVTVTQDLSWEETKMWKVFTGPRLNAAGAVETVTEDTSWNETITFKTFIGPRLNGPSLKLNGTGRANEGPTSAQQQVIQHPDSRTYKCFVAPVAALNARGTVIEDVVDHGWDETITEHRFTGPRLNGPTLTFNSQAGLNAGPKTRFQFLIGRLAGF